MKKQKKLLNSSFGKRFLSTVVSMAMAVTLMPALPAVQAEETELLKAGAINATAETVTQEQPFKAGTAGSNYFRIPALIVTKNGNLLAAADARYSTAGDGGGLDTIASVSKDGGKTWQYSFPLYFPDSDGYAGNAATTIIDPMLVQGDDGTVYCMADVNPTGVTTMGGFTQPKVGTGFITVDGKERLALTSNYSNANTLPTDDNASVYEYYVGDWNEQGYAPVKNRSDNSDSQYAVDKWYNIYSVKNGQYVADLTQKQVNQNSTTDIQQNAFYAGSVLHVYNTGYMMYAVSKDDGMTWGDPVITNPEIKRDDGSESALLVSPGQGLLMKDGTVVIPFYNHGDGEENSSIAWKDKDSNTWKRSNDVPGAGAGGWWTSECEAVELDGMIRLFARSDEGCVVYADAKRNEDGDFVFSAPVKVGAASVTSTCNVTAIKYSKKIDGKDAILVAMPGGSGRANGKIFTFLVNNDENKTLTLKSTFSVPNSSSAYAYSCMSELPDGTIGLLWENSGAAIRYDNFEIMELVPNAYIEGAEIDVDLWANETYTREYVYPSEYMEGITTPADEKIVTATLTRDPEDANTTTKKVLLHPHANTGDNNVTSFNEGFQTAADRNLSVENAEFTITATDSEGIYTVYNESTKQYLCHTSAGNYFAAQKANDMKIVPTADGADTFYISKNDGTRYVAFYLPRFRFDGSGGGLPSTETNKCDLTLLEKQESVTDADDIPGYRKATSITSGKKYLITCNYEVGGVTKRILLYPTNGQNNQTKLVGEVETTIIPQTSTVTIKGVAEGSTKAVIDGITYNIHCKGNPKLNLKMGEKYFFQDVKVEDCSTNDATVAAVAADKQTRNALFNCNSKAIDSLDGYSNEPNWDIDMSAAEFTVTESEDGYTIYNAMEETYFVNTNAVTYFEATPIAQTLVPVQNSDGTVSFELKYSVGDNDFRYAYFYYGVSGSPGMAFDGLKIQESAKEGWKEKGDFGYEFLEKKEIVSNTDPIPGYQRATEIVSGKNYLITEYYKDVILILYPRNGIENQSKLYRTVDVDGVSIEAKKNGITQVTINNLTYDVIINDCNHDGTGRYLKNEVKATCDTKGYTGDVYCAVCNEKIEDGAETEALGHDWGEGVITTQPTLEADGEKTYTCKHDATHTKTEKVSSLDFAKEQLTAAIADATAKAEQTDVYTEATLADLNSKLTAANSAKDSTDKAAVVTALNELQAAINGLVTKEVQEKKDALAEIIGTEIANRDSYTTESLSVLDAAISEAEELLGNADATAAQLQAAYEKVDAALKGLVTKEVQDKKDNLTEIIGTDVGDLNSYTEATRTELNNAIAEANTLLSSGTATAAQLQAAYEKVDAALKGLVTQVKADADKVADTQLSAAEGVLNQKDNYTAESLAEIKKVYDEVQALKNDPKADPAAVTAAVERLKAAIAGLKKKDDTPAPVVIEQGKIYDAGDYYYKVTSTSKMTAEVTKLKNKDVKKLTINSTVNLGGKNYKVTSVAANAFKGNKKVTSITIKKGVTKIGSGAFANCTKVKKAVINSTTLKSIGAKAFSGCKSLKSITIKSKVLKKVGKNTFKGIHKKATIKVPKASLKKYKKLLKKGQAKTVKMK